MNRQEDGDLVLLVTTHKEALGHLDQSCLLCFLSTLGVTPGSFFVKLILSYIGKGCQSKICEGKERDSSVDRNKNP